LSVGRRRWRHRVVRRRRRIVGSVSCVRFRPRARQTRARHRRLGRGAHVSRRSWALAAGAMLLAGCDTYRVARLHDGRLREERFVDEVAYASFVHGAELEAAGNRDAALAAYRAVVSEDPEAIEAWTRIAVVTCRGGGSPDEALAHAERLDPDFAPLWRARAE